MCVFIETECSGGTYGFECEKTCSVSCGGLGNLCDHEDGRCSDGCDAGFIGVRCDQRKINYSCIVRIWNQAHKLKDFKSILRCRCYSEFDVKIF